MTGYNLGRVPRVLVGGDAVAAIRPLFQSLGAESALLVLDPAIAGGAFASKLRTALDGMPLAEHVIPGGEPTCASVNDAADAARRIAGAGIIGVGGGSALDTAKQAAAVAVAARGIEHYLLMAHPFAGRRPLVAIPTTAGTGAEVTRTCVISDDRGRKVWTWSDELLPDAAILDPGATATMPATVTVATGIDAFVHALEACTGQRRNAIAAGPALQAIRLVRRNLPAAVREPGNLGARRSMLEAALLAGLAIDGCGTGIAHCIGHALGTLYHLPHGVAVAVAMEAALAWNVAGHEMEFDDAAAATGVSTVELPAAFRLLLDESRFASAVRAVPAQPLSADAIAATMIAEENEPMLSNNVRVPDDAARHELARATVSAWNAHRASVAT